MKLFPKPMRCLVNEKNKMRRRSRVEKQGMISDMRDVKGSDK